MYPLICSKDNEKRVADGLSQDETQRKIPNPSGQKTVRNRQLIIFPTMTKPCRPAKLSMAGRMFFTLLSQSATNMKNMTLNDENSLNVMPHLTQNHLKTGDYCHLYKGVFLTSHRS